jgi:hypothetical protein
MHYNPRAMWRKQLFAELPGGQNDFKLLILIFFLLYLTLYF